MDITLYIVATVAFAGLIHAGFSLGASMLALLSGHSLSRRRSHARLVALTGSFVTGSAAMTLLLTLAFTYAGMFIATVVFPLSITIWPLALGAFTALTGIWVTFFYYRRGRHGTALWLPRSFARYLAERTAHTKTASESFVLGGASVLYELPVTLWLILTAGTYLPYLMPTLQVPAALGYALVASSSLFIVFMLIGGGHTGASLTRFRARYKRFLQVIVGLSMVLLGGAVFINQFYAATGGQGMWPW